MLERQPPAVVKQMVKYSKAGLPKQLRGMYALPRDPLCFAQRSTSGIVWIRLSGASQLLEDVPGLYDSALTHRFGMSLRFSGSLSIALTSSAFSQDKTLDLAQGPFGPPRLVCITISPVGA